MGWWEEWYATKTIPPLPRRALFPFTKPGRQRSSPEKARVVFERDGWKCQLCGRPTPRERQSTGSPTAPTIDHIVPLSRGGSNHRSNQQTLCRKCNNEKGDS